MSKQITILFLFSLVFLMLPNISEASINIPITISESLPSGVNGVDVTSEPVTTGVPLPENSGITSIGQLGLSGATIGQFKILKRYPNNAIWWVLVDTQASVSAGETAIVSLVDGAGNFGGNNLASETADAITVNTGAASFMVSKSNFNLLDSVVVGTDTLVQAGNSGEILITTGGVTYSSANSDATVTIEENGPARTVVKATGRLTSSGAVNNGGYTIRMHFYKNKSYVRYDTEISNSYNDFTAMWNLDEAKIKQPTTLAGTLNYQFGYNSSISSGTVSDSAWLYQGNQGTYGDRAPDTGLQIGNNGSATHALGTISDYARGWGTLNNGSKSIAVGIAQMKINELSGLEFYADGTIDVSLASKHKSAVTTLQGGQHMLNIMYLDFASVPHSTDTIEHRTQYPLVGRCNLDAYNNAGGVYGIKLVEVQEERDFFTANSEIFPEANINNTLREHVNRNYGWSTSGTPNSDWNLKYLMDYWRTGNGALYSSAMQGVIHNGSIATLRSDNFNYFANPVEFNQSSSYWGRIYDEEHTFWEGQAYLYLVSGNEFIKDSIIDFGEQWETYIKATGYRSFYTLGYSRNWSRSYRNQAILAWILDSQHYADIVDEMTKLLFITPDTDAIHRNGVNYERGYIHPANGINSEFMTSKLFPETLNAVSFCMSSTWESYERIRDLILGQAHFVYEEFYEHNNDACGGFGYNYQYDIDNYIVDALRAKQSEVVLAHAYYQTGETKYLDRAKKLFFQEIECLWGNIVASELGAHALITAVNTPVIAGYIAPEGTGVVSLSPSQVINNNDGTYTINWVAPPGSSGYQIKFSTQPIVDSLIFNNIARAYTYSPNSHDNFWADLNVENEPNPTSGPQSTTIDVQQTINDYNTKYGIIESQSGFVPYAGGQYYFAIKYLSDTLDLTPPASPSGLSVL